ncbi:MAG TPA: glycoside hydrolase family 3 N-terminal domain-containing protein [Candidatus Limiplasma sp.]|nr:glycoside hydrolase family 3 N-terminal domain-containing protein [Candidatus Limiplasma sp.]
MDFALLKQKPFSLNDTQMQWVKETFAGMTQKEKIGQLFCLCLTDGSQEEIDTIKSVCDPGGVMYRPCDMETAVKATKILKDNFKIPMLIAANLEKGGNGVLRQGTMLGSPTEIAATDDVTFAKRLGIICGREGAAVGVNWAFAPIIDIDYNFRNPITNTRTFGSDPARVKAFGKAYVQEVQALGVAASIKHFPGDGRDERDQHLVTSINDFSCEDWDRTYGAAYKTAIDAGAMTVMVGHIMQPAYEKAINPALRDDEMMPATLSPELMQGLLRGKLGFNGLITTDACTMAGFTIPMERAKAVPTAIASGADIFLFARNLEEDYGYMADGVKSGIITQERLDEAVLRILGLKAALNLPGKALPTLAQAQKVVGCQEHLQWAKECADRAVTLVKEEKGVLPLTVEKYPKLLYMPIEAEQGVAYSVKSGVCDHFKAMLEEEGFAVDTYTPSQGHEGAVQRMSYIPDHYDAIVYMANMATKSNQTTVRIEWQQPMGANCPHFIQSIPTIFISVENPYHLLDVPRIKTFINGYSSTDETLNAILNKLMGRDAFVGKAPHDPFCNKWDTKL